MVGENYDLGAPPATTFGEVAPSIPGLSVPDPAGFTLVDKLSLDRRAGEIVCISGLMGKIVLEGREISHLSIAERIARGLALMEPSIKAVTVKTPGSNQQEVVIGKMLAINPRVIMLDEPSRGIDIGAKAKLFKLPAKGVEQGLAGVHITSEVSECLSIAHRIIVMHRGRISAESDSPVSKEKIIAASGESVAA